MKHDAGFTKGPWDVQAVELTNNSFPTRHPHYEIGAKGSMCWVAHVLCFSDQHKGSEYETNAHLIAAAPLLYEALERAIAAIDNLSGWVCGADCHVTNCIRCQAKAALRQARGGQ